MVLLAWFKLGTFVWDHGQLRGEKSHQDSRTFTRVFVQIPDPQGPSPMFFFQAEAKPRIDGCPYTLDPEPVGGHMWGAQAGSVPMLALHFWAFDNPSKMILVKNFPRRRTFATGLSLIKNIIKNHVKWNVIFSVYLNNSKSSRFFFFFLFQKMQCTITCHVTQPSRVSFRFHCPSSEIRGLVWFTQYRWNSLMVKLYKWDLWLYNFLTPKLFPVKMLQIFSWYFWVDGSSENDVITFLISTSLPFSPFVSENVLFS